MTTRYATTRIITWLVAAVMGLGVVMIPAGYFLLSYQYTAGGLEVDAEINARIVNEIINGNPTMWEYETVRLQEYISRRPRQDHAETRRIFNDKGDLVVESADKLDPPVVRRSFEVFDSGVAVGKIELSQSLRPLLVRSGWIFLIMVPVGLFVFVVLRVLPIRMIQRSEKALRDSEETYRTLIDTADDAILVAAADTNRVFLVNRSAEKLFALPAAEILDRKLKDFLKSPVAGVPGDRALVPDDFRTEAHGALEFSLICPDGKEVAVEISMSAAEMRGRKVTQYILRDISDRKEADKRHHDLQEKLDRALRMEAIGLLAGGVAHDLNNMLGPLVGYPELILAKLPQDSPVRKQVMRIGNAAQQAADVIQDLLTLARRGRYEMKLTDLNEVIDSYLDSPGFLKLVGEHPRVTVNLELGRNVGSISGSPPHLAKVIMNLVINAFDAVGDQGSITVRTEQQRLVRLARGHENIEQGEYVTMRVSDTGVGIDPEDIAKIFEPYFSRKKMGRSGMGLGLSVVYGIVKDHKGYYDVLSGKGKGTEFFLYFPVTEAPEQREREAVCDNRGQEEVLIVDDSEEQLELAGDLLISLGYKVATSRNGRQAVEYLRAHRVDLVVLDMIMEDDFDGLDTYRAILELHPDQKAIIASGFSTTDRVMEMQKLGAGQYVRKPYTRETLGRAVRAELEQKRPVAAG